MTDKNYGFKEYSSSTPLIGNEAIFIKIPLSLINNSDIGEKEMAALIYMNLHYGKNNIVGFTIPDMVTYCGNKSDRATGGMNDKFIDALDTLSDMGYITYLTKISKTSFIKCLFDSAMYEDECNNDGFIVLYLDEIEKILEYKKKGVKNNYVTNITMLYLFIFLRHKIYKRPNRLKIEERNTDGTNNILVDIKKRRKLHPEAYAANFNELYENLNISKPTFSKAIDTLEELGLIVVDKAYRIRDDNGKFRTPCSIFANAYKREGGFLLASGEEYSRAEIERKAENIKQRNGLYEINKDKRKTKKGDIDE